MTMRLKQAGVMVTDVAREVLTLALAWAGAAAGVFAAAYIIGASTTGEDPGACTGPVIAAGLSFALPTLISLAAAGATIFVGAYWSLGMRNWMLRVAGLGAVVAIAALTLSVGRLVTGCGGTVFGL
jgi:hypothetical protein